MACAGEPSSDHALGPKETLIALLYRDKAPAQSGLGFAEISMDVESMLAASDPRGYLIVRAQDDNEDATHFEWLGKCGQYGFHLDVMLLGSQAFVEVLDAMAAGDVENQIACMKSKPFLMGV